MITLRQYLQVRELMKSFAQLTPGRFHLPSPQVIQLRRDLIREEAYEFLDATTAHDVLDAVCDLHYVVLGTLVAWGYPKDRVDDASVFLRSKLGQTPDRYEVLHRAPLVAAINWKQQITETLDALGGIQTLAEADFMFRKLLGYVGYAAHICNINLSLFNTAFEIVHQSNMSKLWTDYEVQCSAPANTTAKKVRGLTDRYVVLRADGKFLKSPSFIKPDFKAIL